MKRVGKVASRSAFVVLALLMLTGCMTTACANGVTPVPNNPDCFIVDVEVEVKVELSAGGYRSEKRTIRKSICRGEKVTRKSVAANRECVKS